MTLLSRTTWIAGSRLAAALIQALSLILVARQVGPADFGILAAFMGIVIVLQALFDFGLSTYITRLRAECPESPLITIAIKIFQYAGLVLLVVTVGSAVGVSLVSQRPWWLLIALAAAGYFERQCDVRLTIAMADGEVWKNSLTLLVRRILTMLLLLAMLQTGLNSIASFGIASLAGAIASFVLSHKFVVIENPKTWAKWCHVMDIFSVSKFFWTNSLGVQFRNLDVILVASLATPMVAGYYGAIARSLNPLLLLSTSVATVLLPIAVKSKNSHSKSLYGSISVVLGLVCILYAILAINAAAIVEVAFGPSFGPATTGFQIVLLGLCFASASSMQTALLQAHGKERIAGHVSVCTAVMALMGVGVGVLVGGVTGAAAGLAGSFVVQSILLLICGCRRGSSCLERVGIRWRPWRRIEA